MSSRNLFALAWLVATLPAADAARAQALVVPCLDEARNLVTRTAPGACTGRILLPEEAKAFEEERARRRESTMREQMQRADDDQKEAPKRRLERTGSGVIISADGYALTNRHVVQGCSSISVAFGDGTSGIAMLVAEDAANDLAVVRTDLQVRRVAAFRSDLTNETGLKVSVVGYPSEGLPTIRPSLAPVILNDRGDGEGLPVMTVVGRVRSGHSGSPLLDESGDIIGLIFAKPDEVAIYQQSGKLIDDMGLAVPTQTVLSFLKRAGIQYQMAKGPQPLQEEALLETAAQFVVRLACY